VLTIPTIPSDKDPTMPGLSVTEKEHWKDRITRRIDKRIEAISAADPNFMDRIDREARQWALDSLGLADLQRELEENERQKEALEKREKQIKKAVLARVRGVPAETIDDYCGYQHEHEVTGAIEKRQAVHEDELLAESETGKQILALRREKDDLLDTVWLACSIGQVKQLWQRVGDLLGDQSTKLQREALSIEPVSEA
jgi:hypothetical protein